MFRHINRTLGLLFVILIMAAARLSLAAFPAPPLPSNPSPADAETSAAVTSILQWQSHPTNPAPSPVATPKVVILNTLDSHIMLDRTLAAIRQQFTNFTTVTTSTTTPAVLASLLADAQVLLVPAQDPTVEPGLGTTHAPVLRQFAEAGGLIVVCDGTNAGAGGQFLTNAGLMNVTYAAYSSATARIMASHPVTQDLPTTFTIMNYSSNFSSVGDAQVLVTDTSSNRPVVAIKSIGAGNALLIGFDYFQTNSAMSLLIANAIKNLSVCNGTDFISHDVYFGTANPPTTRIVQDSFAPQCAPGTLTYGTYYYWRVVEHNSGGDTSGPIWSFQTPPLPPPDAASAPTPLDRSIGVPLTQQLEWNPGMYPATYSIRLDTVDPPVEIIASGLTQPKFPLPANVLVNNTTYYWRIVSSNDSGDTEGPVWSFTTPAAPPTPASPSPADGATSISISPRLDWNTIYSGPALTPIDNPKVLVFNYDGTYTNNVLSAIRSRFPNFTTTATSVTTPAALQAQLVGKQVLLIPPQHSVSVLAALGTNCGPVIRQFVKSGGLVLAFDYGNVSYFLKNAGLMNVTAYGQVYMGMTVKRIANVPITQDVPTTFSTMGYNFVYYPFEGQVLLSAPTRGNMPTALYKSIGAGGVVLIGASFNSSTSQMGIIPGNAIQKLSLSRGTNYATYDLYFGTTNPPTRKIASASYADFYTTSSLAYDTWHYWKVVAHTAGGDAAGPVWSFRTGDPPPPTPATNGRPDGARVGNLNPILSWTPGAIPATYSVYLDHSNPPMTKIASGLTSPYFTPTLQPGKSYLWRVVSENISGTATSQTWLFYPPPVQKAPAGPSPVDGLTTNSLRPYLKWNRTTTTTATTVVPIAIFRPHLSLNNQYANVTTVIQLNVPQYWVRDITTEDTVTLATELDAARVLIVLEQSSAGWSFADYGTKAGPILRKFVESGGLVVVLNGYSSSGSDAFMANAGLMNVQNRNNVNNLYADQVSSNPILSGVQYTIGLLNDACSFWVLDDSQVLYKDHFSKGPVAAIRTVKAGTVLTLGWNYASNLSYSGDMAKILANAINMLGRSGNEYYDIYFGATNPPSDLLATTTSLRVRTTPLNYETNYYWQVVARGGGGDGASPVWTFRTREVPLPGVPSNPTPANGATGQSRFTDLQWAATPGALTYSVYMGISNPPTNLAADHISSPHCLPGVLDYATTYYWKVVAHNNFGDTSGPVWSFRTMNLPPPGAPSNPSPANLSINVPTNTTLSWAAGSIPATFSVKLGTTNPPTTVVGTGLTQPTFKPGTLALSRTYYWQVTATNATGSTAGPVWSFTTPMAPGMPSNATPAPNQLNVDPKANLKWPAAAYATSYSVFIGTTTSPSTKILDHGAATECAPTLNYATTYYWRIIAHNAYADTTGPVWGFRTMNLPKPDAPSNPQPEDNATYITTSTLSWAAGSIPATFSVKFGKTNPPTTQIASGLSQPLCTHDAMTTATTYYWQVTATNAAGSVAGPVWKLHTPGPPLIPTNPWPRNAQKAPLDTRLTWNGVPEKPVHILAFIGHSDNGPTGEYQKTLAAIRMHFTNFDVTETTSTDPATIGGLLAGKQVFLLPAQKYWTDHWMSIFGMNMMYVMNNFTKNAGVVIACESYPQQGASSFMCESRILPALDFHNLNGVASTAIVGTYHAITMDVAPTFPSAGNAGTYNNSITNLIVNGTGRSFVVLNPAYYCGTALILGWDFSGYNKEMGRILANTIRYMGNGSRVNETYDLYFGTTNPPTTKIHSYVACAPITPPALEYGKTYYWYVKAKNSYGTATSPVWSFSTSDRAAVPAHDWSCYK